MSRAVCINPPGMPGTTANREGAGGMGNVYPKAGAFLYPPHTLAAAAGALREGGTKVIARDCVLEGDRIPEAVAWAAAQQPDYLVVQVSWATRDADTAFLREARAALPGAAVVAVGASVPMMEGHLREVPGIAWLYGEPERLSAGLFVALGTDPLKLQGPLTPAALPSTDAPGERWLEGLPHPAWNLFSWRGYGMLTIVGSKGCDQSCSYCPYVVAQGRKFRPRPVHEVADELVQLATKFKPPRVVFRDPVFAHDRGRVLDLCREIGRRGIRVAWECESRADDLDAEMVELMARAGCTTVKLGLESADPDVLVAVRRVRDAACAEIYRRRALAAAAACRQHGIACRVFAMTGLAGETEKSIDSTIGFIHEMQPSALTVKVVDWYPGTRMERQADGATAELRARRLNESWTPAPPPAKPRLLARVKRKVLG